jgi:hypothetical protein
MRSLFVLNSQNAKLRGTAASYHSSDTCWSGCGMRDACYAKTGHTSLAWKRCDDKGLSWPAFVVALGRLLPGERYRYGVCGDLPGVAAEVDAAKLAELGRATSKAVSWAYTHKPTGAGYRKNALAIAAQNRRPGLAINLSADNLAQADEYVDRAIGPVVVVLPKDTATSQRTPKGRLVVVCPASLGQASCSTCGGSDGPLCARKDRTYIVGFPAHGSAAKKADVIAQGGLAQ